MRGAEKRRTCVQGYSVGGTVGSPVKAWGAGRLCIGVMEERNFRNGEEGQVCEKVAGVAMRRYLDCLGLGRAL